MTDEQATHYGRFPLHRRDVLKIAAVGAGITALGGIGFTGRAVADSHIEETLYLTDSGGDNSDVGLTNLYTVELVDGDTPKAMLTLEYALTDTDFGQVDAIAASLDGELVYMIDKTSRHLGVYTVESGAFEDKGQIDGLPGGVVLATYSPDGTLFAASQNTNAMYTIDVTGPSATKYVDISGANVQGADIAFDADGVLYLYSSGSESLYTIDYEMGSGTFGQATLVGETGDFFTGLAVRAAGTGDLVGSNTTRDEIVVVDKGTGAKGTEYEMYIGETPYAYGYGDMTVGALQLCLPCEFDGTYKFEYVYDEEMELDGFYLEDGEGFDAITYVGYESKEGEDYEPIAVTFDSDICPEYIIATVKAGRETHEVELLGTEDGFVVSIEEDERFVHPRNGKPFAISYIAFECVEIENGDEIDE